MERRHSLIGKTAMSDYLVLGCNSFSGSHLISQLLAEGCTVIGISRSALPHPVFLPYDPINEKNFSFYQYDLNRDLDQIITLINNERPPYIVNFAAQGMVAESWSRPEQWLMTNTVSAIRLHHALRHADWLKRFVQISTPEVYGACTQRICENTVYHPSTPYAVSKAAVDMSLMTFFRQYNFPVVFTRSANVYGPGQQLYRIIPKAILRFLTNKKLQLHGGGTSVRSFIHIRDVVEGTCKIMHNANAGEIFHLSTPQYISIRDLVSLIAAQLNISFEDHVDTVSERPGKDSAYILDSEKVRICFEWREKITLEQGISETIKWVRDNIDHLLKFPTHYIHKA